jgi:hypothetical protein
MTAVGNADPRLAVAVEGHVFIRPACLRGKGAAAAFLAIKAVANRNPNRFTRAMGL